MARYSDFSTLRCSVDICCLEQTTFNKHRKYNYKSKHMHGNICYITQSKTGYVPPGRHSVIAECRDALNMHTDYT